jgi:hypothetical protein
VFVSRTLFTLVGNDETGDCLAAEHSNAKTCFNLVVTHLPCGFFFFSSVKDALSLLSSLANDTKETQQLCKP